MDVFGRERFNDHRDDRGGVGSMQSDSRTLYVGRIHQDLNMQDTVEKHFKLWGEVERIKILKEKGVAFVTYQSRLNAEFAKEAMANQSLDHGEIINIRWATEDPNPKAQATNKRKAVEMTRQAIESRLPDSVKQVDHLPGFEENIDHVGKRSKLPDTDATTSDQAAMPQPYLGQDGQYYYDYGTYGYNYETQEYDPARLFHQPQPDLQRQAQITTTAPSIQDRVNAALSAAASASAPKTEKINVAPKVEKPAISALGALAAYGSDSESEDEE
ncbi:Pre-mRNA-splicing factor [Gryganskiella cystojenkinii]|nr:Pre-mRNA-splicing factor [Gryganskiella cystojenkinii]